ncbi:kinetochore scaffold 1 isoform X2 [Clupea harengus]|uniref:Kinetochore scaffold 1 isoform X2 n=1 Tax=Clupea harengus TaxID=7950 RepID=A0A6P8GEE5_CLUHA|nr:kinetochore scaffold 1 isoform X2 [Clupea harengus]
MESTETFNFDFERVGSSKRRISSILKAPRTSVKVTESSLKEPQQGDKSKPTEKRRSSRRVSFAATKNVVVFAKDMTSSSEEQSPSPSLTPMGAGSQDAKVMYDGIENLLKAPLQVSHQRDENQFFPDVFLPDGCNDKTVLFGEDTACMDMTHCHTVVIDKESDKSGLNFTTNTEMSVSRICKPTNMEDTMLQKNICLVDKGNAYSQNAEPASDFGAFLASMTQQKGVGNKSRNERPYMARDQTLLFEGDDMAHMDMTHSHTVMIDDDSNETDLNFFKKAEMPVSGIFKTINKEDNMPQRNVELANKAATDGDFEVFLAGLTKQKGLGNAKSEQSFPAIQSSSVPFHTQKVDSNSFFARLNAHRSVTDKENQPPALPDRSVSKPQGLHLRRSSTPSAEHDFMDLTKSHTVAIDRRGCLQSQQATQREKQWAIGQGSTNASRLDCDGLVGSLKSPDPDDMDLTRSQTVAINFKSMDVVRPSLSNVRRCERSFLDPNQTQIFSGNNVGMELTGVIDGTEVQENIPQKMPVQTESRFSLSKLRGASVHAPQPVSQQQRISHFQNDMWTVDPAKTDDMELTKSQTVVIDSKGYERDRPNKTRKSLSTNRSVIFAQNDEGMEFTEPFTGHLEARKRGSQSISMDMKINQTGAASDSEDMEMTKSQTVVIDSKAYKQEKPVKSRKSLSTNRSVMFAQNDDGMEMTEVLSGHIKANSYSNRRECDAQGVSMDMKINQTVSSGGKSLWGAALDSEDMEMTKSQTVVIDSKAYKQEKPVRSTKSLSTNRSVMFAQNDDGMEMTEALSGHIKANSYSNRRECDAQSVSMDMKINTNVPDNGKSFWADTSDSNDMEMTKSQTVVIDSKDYDQVKAPKSRKSLSTNKSVLFSKNDDCMEMSEALTGHMDANRHSVRDGSDQTSPRVFLNQTVQQSQPHVEALFSEADDMEITRSQTVVIDSKNRGITGNGSSHSSHMEIAESQKDLTESNQPIKGSLLRKSMMKSLSCVPSSSLQNTMFGNDPYSERKEATTVSGDDMEITRSQTVVIDAKHKRMSGDSDPKVHTLTTKWKNSISPMTDATFPSSQMTSQANVLQMSTAGEDMGFTTRKAAAMDSNSSEVNDGCKSTTKKFFPFDPLISKPCESEGITTDLSFITGQKVFPSLWVDDMELTSSKVTKSVPYMAAESKTQCSSDEGYVLKMTKSAQLASDERYGAPLHEEDPVALMSQSREVIGESSSVRGRGIHHDQRSSLCAEENVDSAEPDPVSPPDHTVTKRSDPISQKSKSRRRSLLDLQSKLRRISQAINDPAQSVVNSATLPLPRLEVTEMFTDNPEMADTIGCSNQNAVEVLTEQPDHVESSRKTSVKHETKPLTARRSFGGFLPKLPSRQKPIITDHVSETTKTFKSNFLEIDLDATSNLGNSEMDDIHAEQLPEMSSDEDISVTVDDHSFKQTQEEDGHCGANPLPEDLVHNVSPTLNVTKNLKRPRPEDDHDNMPLEQKRKQEVLPTEVTGSAFSSIRWETNATEEASNVMTKTIDGTSSSSNSTYLKSEATFESTYKYSQCDSQIERTLDYEFDFYKKIEDGSITMNEFLRHFGIDFVIHRSRPSALPDNFSPDPTPKMEHLLNELFIYRPKQRVYEADCEKLAAMVEGLKSRMLEQDRPVRHINESLWQELTNLSKEQLLSFGSKLKERKVHFRKRSKMLSHEMKAGMYSELVHTTQETKHQLEEKVLETDTLLKDLDACIHDLEVELEAVDSALRVDQVHAQSEIQPALRKRQEELERLDSAVAEKQRQMVHVESEKKNKAEKLDRLREEVKDIKKHTSVLHSVNEWKLSLKENGRTLIGFLHNTLLLEVVHQPPSGMLAPNDDTEQKLLDVSFHFQSDDKSECHSIIVHDLLSKLFKSETDWLKRYSTTRDIPMLLHDVSLAVSRIRLLGEEIQRLKRWGALRLSVLEISCADRQVQIVFSSLKAFVKFQLTLMVTCAYPFGGIKVHSFQNYIGNTSVDQIEDVLSSIEPAKGYLTQFIKMIHDHLLV